MLGSQLKNNSVEQYFKRYITNQELLCKLPFTKKLSLSETLQKFYTMQQITFHKVLISRKLFFVVLSEKYIFIFNLKNRLVQTFSSSKPNSISQEGKKTVLMKINENSHKLQLVMRFMTKNEKNAFLNELGLRILNKKNNSSYSHYVKLLIELITNDNRVLRYLIESNRKQIKKNEKVYYFKQIFKMSNSNYLNYPNCKDFYRTYKHLNFLISSKLIEKLFKPNPNFQIDSIGYNDENEDEGKYVSETDTMFFLENQVFPCFIYSLKEK